MAFCNYCEERGPSFSLCKNEEERRICQMSQQNAELLRAQVIEECVEVILNSPYARMADSEDWTISLGTVLAKKLRALAAAPSKDVIIKYHTSAVEIEEKLRAKLIELGWTPPHSK